MLKCASLIAILLLAVPMSCKAEHVIDFSNGGNLKMVYDAGLRPRSIGELSRTIFFTDQEVRLVLLASFGFNLDVDIGSFAVLTDNNLEYAEFISQPMNFSTGVQKVEEICTLTGLSMTGLDAAVSKFERNGRKAPDPRYWVGMIKMDKMRVTVGFEPLFTRSEMFARVRVRVDFNREEKLRLNSFGPVDTPTGYYDAR